MTAKKVNVKDFLINNGIIVVLLLLAVFTAIKQPTFFSGGNLINIALNVAPRFIIACGVSGCLITTGTDLSAGRMVGLAAWQVHYSRNRTTAVNSSRIFRISEMPGAYGFSRFF